MKRMSTPATQLSVEQVQSRKDVEYREGMVGRHAGTLSCSSFMLELLFVGWCLLTHAVTAMCELGLQLACS